MKQSYIYCTTRSNEEIHFEILECIPPDGAKMYKMQNNAHVDYRMLKRHLPKIIARGLLHYDIKTSKYHITHQGHKFLKIRRETADLFS